MDLLRTISYGVDAVQFVSCGVSVVQIVSCGVGVVQIVGHGRPMGVRLQIASACWDVFQSVQPAGTARIAPCRVVSV